MNEEAKRVQFAYLSITLASTLATSFIWGINTLFLLSAGLSNTQAFAVNAFFTAGMVLFEVPTGVVADAWSRRGSYLLGVMTLSLSTLFYLFLWSTKGSFVLWAFASIITGLGFTFFSGATEAWLVDALKFTKFTGKLESVFAKGQVVSGVAMLSGSVAGGLLAQATDLGAPFIARSVMLVITFIVAFVFMKDLGFSPKENAKPLAEMKLIVRASIDHGWRNPPVKWLMLAGPFNMGVGIYAFYAMQPHLLELYGDDKAFGVAGLAAAVVAGAQIAGGLLATKVHKLVPRRSNILAITVASSIIVLAGIGLNNNFWVAVGLLTVWALVFAAARPVRQAFINELIPSEQRATVLSFDSLLSSTGGVVSQPSLGRVADVYGYPASYLVSSVAQIAAIPFTLKARATNSPADFYDDDENSDDSNVMNQVTNSGEDADIGG